MLFISVDDFFKKAGQAAALTREEEAAYAEKMQAGDREAREALLRGYLPFVASVIRHQRSEHQTLELVMRCQTALEKAVDSFDFLQNSETFSHRLSWWMRQTVTRYMADKRGGEEFR